MREIAPLWALEMSKFKVTKLGLKTIFFENFREMKEDLLWKKATTVID